MIALELVWGHGHPPRAIVVATIATLAVLDWISVSTRGTIPATRRRPPRPHCPDSYWAGYRKGHSDGQLFALIRERNPSRN